MARQANKLSARGIQALLRKPGLHGDGASLYLAVGASGAASWVYRYRRAGKLHDAGLGSLKDISLADARLKAAEMRKLLAEGSDPLAVRKAERATAAGVTFGAMADQLIESLTPGWRNPKHAAQWKTTLGRDYLGALRDKAVADVDTSDVLMVLTPIWQATPETASRIRGRIEMVLNAAKARGLRSGENPATWRGHLDHLLPRRQKLSRGHHRAMVFSEVPGFLQRLRTVDGAMAAKALEFVVLTAARSGEALGATWEEIDLETKVWTIPAGRMKAGVEHRVPLSDAAVALLRSVKDADRGVVFPGPRSGGPMSDMAMSMLLRRMGVDCTVHGFRSSFRDWAGETTSFPREVAEQALAHAVGDEVERAYRRSDALEKRRSLMESWAQYLDAAPAGNVIKLRG